MTKDLLVRGIDDNIHSELGSIALRQSTSINSIVKDAVEKWIQNSSKSLKKHDLIIYCSDSSIEELVGDLGKMVAANNLLREYYGVSAPAFEKILAEQNWRDLGSLSDKQKSKDAQKKYADFLKRVTKESETKICCLNFGLNDFMGKNDPEFVITLEKQYNQARCDGLMYCLLKYENMISNPINYIIRLFKEHDQVFILQDGTLYKIYLTRENIQKLLS